MAAWYRKFGKNVREDEPADYILFHQEPMPQQPEEVFEDTGKIDAEAIEAALIEAEQHMETDMEEPILPEEDEEDRLIGGEDEEALKPAPSRKKWLWGSVIAVASVAVIVGLFLAFTFLSNPLRGYLQEEVVKGNVILSMPAEGTLVENDRYVITSMVPGKVTNVTAEVGDKVTKGSVLYKLDDTEAKIWVERAKNELSKSKVSGTTSSTERIYATAAGHITSLNIRSGNSVSIGQVVATVTDATGNTSSIVSPISGTVASVSVKEGSSVSVNSIVATIRSTNNDTKGTVYDQKISELDVQSAQAQLENYTIKAPVTGTVIERNAKIGDVVGMMDFANPMMVILDNTSLKFSFWVDEYTVGKLEKGMPVLVNTESIPNESFAGEVSFVSYDGVLQEDGKVLFEVGVLIEEPGDLKKGMKVSAKVILDSATNVPYVPHQALMEADGESALVLVKDDGTSLNTSSNGIDEELTYPWIQVPEGFRLVRVRYGVADGTNVEILSGLKVGDFIIYNPEAALVNLEPTATAEAGTVEDLLQAEKEKAEKEAEEAKAAEEAEKADPEATASAKPTSSAKPQTTSL